MRTPQAPIGSRFNAASTAAEVMQGIDLKGKTAIVTGGHSGLGLETARVLRHAGARVIVPARDLDRARKGLGGLDVELAPMDLIDSASIDAFANGFLDSGEPLHILINNAGIMAGPLVRDARGYEAQFATNHLGHFQLVSRLRPALRKANGARVVSVSSWGHRFSKVIFDDIHFERREYNGWLGYGQSKTANILFALALDDRAKPENIRAFAVHPGGIIDTNLGKHVNREDLKHSGFVDAQGNAVIDPARGMKTVEQGAATQVWCAVSPQLDGLGGVYCENCEISRPVAEEGIPRAHIRDATQKFGVFPYAIDRDAAEELWKLSEEMLEARPR